VEEIVIARVKISELGTCAFDLNNLDLRVGDYCIVEAHDDVELGEVAGKIKVQRQGSSRSIRKVLRKATEEDKKQFEENKRREAEAHETCQRKIRDRELPMKLVKSRYSFDGKKITFYFTSEKRVDFRDLVKDLAYIFKRRIELRQIRVRDEARMIGGFGSCGRQLCCTTCLRKLGRLTIKMAKEQGMTITPSKISGVCGRLLCCLQYENDWYKEMKEIMPQVGSIFKYKDVSGKVEELDPFHCVVKIRDDDGRLIPIKLEDSHREDLQKKRKKAESKERRGKKQG